MTIIGPVSGDFNPTHASIEYSDNSGVNVTSVRARFARPVTSDTGYAAACGARVRFRTNAPNVTIRLGYNTLMLDSYLDSYSILVNGVPTDYAPGSHLTDFTKVLSFGNTDYRNIEIIMPFGTGLDFKGVSQDARYDFRACRPRPVTKLLAIGDSITQGAVSTKTRAGYVYRLGEALRLQTVNMGYAGAQTNYFGSFTWAEAIDPDLVTVLLGFNDYSNQVAESTFKSRYTTLLNGLITNTTAKILVITPLWTNSALTVPISSYRTWISSVVTTIGNARISVTDGLPLAVNSTAQFPDGIHPNDTGFTSIASGLTPIISGLIG